ncbi:hypothetical protein FB563_5227 [Streptomyces puniciscabiei]|uniref:Uncharacterized protein n=1 Tax=Streptomyces puniciscabiei TaxID=164348 RepID=A0A542UM14_9ACTN|nr:hypothetical protein [Streptomyces puniciscabiei]TQL00139.1 hypothetical protein FB563_5227 [Streptomyces puniciscabiei]
MQTIHTKTSSLPLLAGAATAVALTGALLALADSDSPLRGPCSLLFLLAAPATALAAALRGLDPFGRALCALAGSVVVNMLIAQGMLAVHRWSVRGGVIAVTVLSLLLLLLVVIREQISGKRTQQRATPAKVV